MNDLDVDGLKASLNIVDIIGRYVQLKKAGNNYFGCCPFHAEKTASFSVSENKQFYYCFGCSAQGDVIKFVQEYTGCDFIDAYKELGGEIELMPTDKVKRNIQSSNRIIKEKVPPDHKQDEQKTALCLQKMVKNESVKPVKYLHDRGIAYPIYTANRQLVNAAIFPDGKPMEFIAGGISYNGFTPIKVNDTNNFVACVSLSLGRILANDFNLNVAVCWNELVMKYICKWNYGELSIKPVIEKFDDDYLCYEMDWIKAEEINGDINIKDMVRIDV